MVLYAQVKAQASEIATLRSLLAGQAAGEGKLDGECGGESMRERRGCGMQSSELEASCGDGSGGGSGEGKMDRWLKRATATVQTKGGTGARQDTEGGAGREGVEGAGAENCAHGHRSGEAAGQDEGDTWEEEANGKGGSEATAQNGTSEVTANGATAATKPVVSVSKRRGGPRFERPKRGAERQMATEAVEAGAEREEQSNGPAPDGELGVAT